MAARKSTTPEPTPSFDEAYAALVERMRDVHVSRISEMPQIELYLDQLLSLVGTELAFMYGSEEKVVTGSMVNNYVKQGLLPAPRRRRYTRRHLASLIFVCVFKQVLSIAQVARVRDMCTAADVDVEQAYDELVELLEHALAAQFTQGPGDRPVACEVSVDLFSVDGAPIDGELNRLLESGVVLVAHKVYLSHLLALEALRDDEGRTA